MKWHEDTWSTCSFFQEHRCISLFLSRIWIYHNLANSSFGMPFMQGACFHEINFKGGQTPTANVERGTARHSPPGWKRGSESIIRPQASASEVIRPPGLEQNILWISRSTTVSALRTAPWPKLWYDHISNGKEFMNAPRTGAAILSTLWHTRKRGGKFVVQFWTIQCVCSTSFQPLVFHSNPALALADAGRTTTSFHWECSDVNPSRATLCLGHMSSLFKTKVATCVNGLRLGPFWNLDLLQP